MSFSCYIREQAFEYILHTKLTKKIKLYHIVEQCINIASFEKYATYQFRFYHSQWFLHWKLLQLLQIPRVNWRFLSRNIDFSYSKSTSSENFSEM